MRASPLLGVDHGVAGHVNMLVCNTLSLQRHQRTLRRRKVKPCEAADHLAQSLLGEWTVKVVSAKSRLNVRQRYTVVERCERAKKSAFGVALHNDQGPVLLGHHGVKLLPAASAELQQAAAPTLECDVRHHVETGQDLTRHFFMLTGVQPLHTSPPGITERVVERRQLDDFRTCARDKENVMHR